MTRSAMWLERVSFLFQEATCPMPTHSESNGPLIDVDLEALSARVAQSVTDDLAARLAQDVADRLKIDALLGDDLVISVSDAARYLGRRRSTLALWRKLGQGPTSVQLGPHSYGYS